MFSDLENRAGEDLRVLSLRLSLKFYCTKKACGSDINQWLVRMLRNKQPVSTEGEFKRRDDWIGRKTDTQVMEQS